MDNLFFHVVKYQYYCLSQYLLSNIFFHSFYLQYTILVFSVKVGDGTTSVVIIAAELLKNADELGRFS